MNAELQGYTDPNGVSSAARPVDHHTSASAQNGEAGSLESGRRSGAATRLNMDDVVMTASSEATFPPGLAGAAAPPGDGSVAFDGFPAQNRPEQASDNNISSKDDEGAKIEVDVSEWSLDEWLADHRGLEDPEKIIDKETLTYSPMEGCVRDARVILSPRSRWA